MANVTKTTENSIAYKVLVEPWITEESTRISELNKYVFKVDSKATKDEIKRSIEAVYNVGVISVNTVKIPRKAIFRGRTMGWKSAFKKAIVTVKEGDKIDIFQN